MVAPSQQIRSNVPPSLWQTLCTAHNTHNFFHLLIPLHVHICWLFRDNTTTVRQTNTATWLTWQRANGAAMQMRYRPVGCWAARSQTARCQSQFMPKQRSKQQINTPPNPAFSSSSQLPSSSHLSLPPSLSLSVPTAWLSAVSAVASLAIITTHWGEDMEEETQGKQKSGGSQKKPQSNWKVDCVHIMWEMVGVVRGWGGKAGWRFEDENGGRGDRRWEEEGGMKGTKKMSTELQKWGQERKNEISGRGS